MFSSVTTSIRHSINSTRSAMEEPSLLIAGWSDGLRGIDILRYLFGCRSGSRAGPEGGNAGIGGDCLAAGPCDVQPLHQRIAAPVQRSSKRPQVALQRQNQPAVPLPDRL